MPIYMPKIKVRYLSISEILTIKEYWNLIGQEQFLAINWEPDFPQACSFCRKLMNHKNFPFTQILDKTNDMIFLKSPKTLFFGHFWSFLVIFAQWGFFPKNLALSHVTIHGRLTPMSQVIPFLFQNDQIALNKISFRKTINIIPMSLLALFIVQNFKTIFTAAPELRMVNLLQKSIFGEKSLILSSSTYWPISLCQISKFFYNRPRVMRTRVPFVDPKWINFPKRKFFRKPGDKPSSYHSSLSTFQESKSDISLFLKYWRLKNTEISLICQEPVLAKA